MRAVDLRAERTKRDIDAQWITMINENIPFETVHRRRDGSEFPVEITMGPFDVDGRRFMQTFVRDVSHRKHLETELARLVRVQTALQAAVGLLLRARNEHELYQGMCDVLIETGGYRLADVALARQDLAKSVEFVAFAGHNDGYLDQARIRWGEGPRSKGPTDRAFRIGEVQIN